MFQWIIKSKTRRKIIDINNNEPLFYPYSIKNKCIGSCNNDDPHSKLSVLDVVKALMSKYLI